MRRRNLFSGPLAHRLFMESLLNNDQAAIAHMDDATLAAAVQITRAHCWENSTASVIREMEARGLPIPATQITPQAQRVLRQAVKLLQSKLTEEQLAAARARTLKILDESALRATLGMAREYKWEKVGAAVLQEMATRGIEAPTGEKVGQ